MPSMNKKDNYLISNRYEVFDSGVFKEKLNKYIGVIANGKN